MANMHSNCVSIWIVCHRPHCSWGTEATLTPCLWHSPHIVTHEPTVELCQRLGLRMPLTHIQELWTQRHERQCNRGTGLAPNDFVALFDYQAHHTHVMQVFQHTDNPTFVDILPCPYCDFSTQQPINLTTHLRKIHHVATDVNHFIPLRDAAAGHPQCTHCSRRLATRGGLLRHICHYPCIHFDEHRPWQAALADEPELRRMASLHDWSSLTLLDQIRRQCVLCGLQYATRKSMVAHLQRDHAHAWALNNLSRFDNLQSLRRLWTCRQESSCMLGITATCHHWGAHSTRPHCGSICVSTNTGDTHTLASPYKRARQTDYDTIDYWSNLPTSSGCNGWRLYMCALQHHSQDHVHSETPYWGRLLQAILCWTSYRHPCPMYMALASQTCSSRSLGSPGGWRCQANPMHHLHIMRPTAPEIRCYPSPSP